MSEVSEKVQHKLRVASHIDMRGEELLKTSISILGQNDPVSTAEVAQTIHPSEGLHTAVEPRSI